MQGNTFQAILITDGSKSYAVFTYRCEQLEWSDEATIGINTPDDIIINHPLSGTDLIDEIACIHVDSPWKNLIYELEPNPVILPITPPPSNSLGKKKYYRFEAHTFSCSIINATQAAVVLLDSQIAAQVPPALGHRFPTVTVIASADYLVIAALISM